MKKHSFKPLCWNVNEDCDVDVAIDRAGYQSKKTAGEKLLFKFSWFFFSRPVSPSGIYDTLLLPLMLLTTTAKKKTLFAGIRVYSRGIAGFAEQRAALTHAQSAILQTRDFNFRVERALKISYPRS